MNTLTRRVIRLAALTMGLAGLFVTVSAVPGAATNPVGFTSELLGRGTYQNHATLPLRQGQDIVAVKLTVTGGGNSGWHSHPGGAIVIVQEGDITIYRSIRHGDDRQGQSKSDQERGGHFPHCVINTYTHGQSFTELPGEVDLVVNSSGSNNYVLFVMFPSVPTGAVTRIDQPNPGTCPV